ncbi:MAG TPA: ABC transporter ATP-binding protein [Tepidisphaeraceae bacterium]|nr:ABC transporter ATP-binding protein [Tepidisphaeraceae bacterium]
MGETAVSVGGLVKRYGSVVAVDGISFDVGRGEVFGLLGPNGAGKTTTVECIIGLRRADGGTIRVCGADAIKQAEWVKSRIGCQLQGTALQEKITPRQALRLFASFYEHAADVEKLLERFDLKEKADKRYETLSGGQRQRVALALAFVNQPEVLFLDEPTAGVDPEARRALHDLIRQFRQQGLTVILTTHYIDEAEALCDRLAIIDHGRIIALGSPGELTAKVSVPSRIIFRPRRPLEVGDLGDLAGGGEVTETGEGWQIFTNDVSRTLTSLIGGLAAAGNEIAELRVRHATLEDAYLRFLSGS